MSEPTVAPSKIRVVITAVLYWLGWAAVGIGSAEVLVSRGLAYAESAWAVPAWWGGLSVAIGAGFKLSRWAIPIVIQALTKQVQQPGLSRNEVILAVAMALMAAGGNTVALPADPVAACDVAGGCEDAAAPAKDVLEVAPDATWVPDEVNAEEADHG